MKLLIDTHKVGFFVRKTLFLVKFSKKNEFCG
jgi:hypothetical protein